MHKNGGSGCETRNMPLRNRTSLDPVAIAGLHELAARTIGGADQMRQLVELFLHDTAGRLDELTAAVEAGDAMRVAALAHNLCGSCANLGARDMAERCRDMEREANDGRVEAARLGPLVAAFDRAHAELRAEFLDTQRAAPQ